MFLAHRYFDPWRLVPPVGAVVSGVFATWLVLLPITSAFGVVVLACLAALVASFVAILLDSSASVILGVVALAAWFVWQLVVFFCIHLFALVPSPLTLFITLMGGLIAVVWALYGSY